MTTHRHDHVTWQATVRCVRGHRQDTQQGILNGKKGEDNITWSLLQSGETAIVYAYNKQAFDI